MTLVSLSSFGVWGAPSAFAAPAAPPQVQRLPGPDRDDIIKGRQRPQVDEGSVLVQFSSPRSLADAGAVLADHGLGRRGVTKPAGFVEVPTGGRPASGVRKDLQADPRVKSVEPNYVRRATATPNDPSFPQQRSLIASRFPEAWNVQPSAPSVTVAVLDTGVDLDHPDLADQLVPGWDAVGGDSYPQDENGHGTMVAGIIGATGGNARGIAGGAYRTRIQPIRVLDAQGSGTDADIIEGITWAADNGAQVINLSLAGPEPSSALAAAVASAQARGVLVVAASGNTSGPQAQYPAALPGVLAVGATDGDGALTFFSSHGAWLDLAAVGVDVLSTTLGPSNADSYAQGAGTSFSAPVVTAAAALVRQAHPTWTATQVSTQLTSTARDAGPPGHDDGYGFGFLDIYAALGGPTLGPLPSAGGDAREPNPVPEQASVVSGRATATIAPELDVDWFAFDVADPRWMTAEADPLGGSAWQVMDPTITVYGPTGNEVASIDLAGPGEAERAIFRAESAGRYRIRVGSYNASLGAATYELDVASSPAPPVGYAPFEAYPTGSWPEATSIADVTGDGLDDVILTTTFYFSPENDYSVFVFPQRADGTLGPKVRHRPVGAGAMTSATGDLDQDGDADLAVATSAGIEVFLQSGGALSGPTVVAFPAETTQVEIVDVDGDGRNDLVARTGGGVQMRTGAPGGWQPPRTLTPDFGNELEVGDISGDGRADLVLTRADCPVDVCTAGMSTYVQQDGGGFAKLHHPTIHGYWPVVDGAAIGDVNGDGRNDVTVTIGGNRPGSRINTFYQSAAGTLGPAQVKVLYDIPEPIEAADVDGDGRVDLVTAHGGWNAIGTIPQQPDGTLGEEVLDGAPYASHYNLKGLSIGDLDAGPGLEVALADYNNGLIVFRQGRSQPSGEPLWVYGTSPLDGLTTIAPAAPLTITFGRAMDPASLTAATTALLDGSSLAPIAATRSYDAATRRLTLTPQAPLASGLTLQLVIDGVRDTGGARMEVREVVRFRTAAPSASAGYWMAGSTGTVYGFGAALPLGNMVVPTGQVATGFAPTPSGNGYFVVTSLGRVGAFGDALHRGEQPPLRIGETVRSISVHSGGLGYWLFTSQGRVFPFGSVASFGDLSAVRLSGPVLGSVATPSGNGYYMVASDGGIFAFGDARFRGSMGGQRLNAPVVGLAPDPDGLGYWLVASDGGIFAFDSPFRGSTGNIRLNRPVIGMVAYGYGYLMVASDGGIFSFSDKPFLGSLGANPPPNPIAAVGVRST